MRGRYKSLPPCEALLEAGITDPESQEGIDFCTTKCPYEYCVAVERKGGYKMHVRKTKQAEAALRLRQEGRSRKEIAEELGVSIRTVTRYLGGK